MSDAAALGRGAAATAAAIEALAARAVPAAEVVERGGWLLRATPGSARKRSNSALPLPRGGDAAARAAAVDPAAAAALAEIDVVEAFYRARGLTPVVQVAPLEAHGALDATLAARGWQAHAPTDVLVADAAAVARAVAAAPAAGVEIALDGARATATLDGRLAGSGHAVADGGWSGLFAMETVPEARRRGVARTLLGALARWSAADGHERLYLQVTADNAPAQALYRALGFTRSHGYHYRVAR